MNIYSKVKAAGIAGAIVVILIAVLREAWGIEVPSDVANALIVVVGFVAGFFKKEKVGARLGLALAFAVLLFPQTAKAQAIQLQTKDAFAIGGGSMLGEESVTFSWRAAFASVQWHSLALAGENAFTGVNFEIHPASVLSTYKDNIITQQIETTDFRLWSLNRVKMSALQLPGDFWEKIFLGADVLLLEGGSTDFTEGFIKRLAFGVRDGPIKLEIYMFEPYRPVYFAAFYWF